jgi:glyoxylase-like metal-dependent hydrolase (beta-lactamase superfamily II)
MFLECRELEPIGTNAYFVANEALKQAFVVDAPLGAFAWAKRLSNSLGCTIEALLLTHGHWDHILDAHLFANEGISIMGHSADKLLFENPEVMASFSIPGIEFKGFSVDQWLEEKRSLKVAGMEMEIFEVPGHCPGSLLFYLEKESLAFVGDAIFCRGIGRCDLPGGNFETLKNSIQKKIYSLPDKTELYSGHGPKTTVFDEKQENPFVRI